MGQNGDPGTKPEKRRERPEHWPPNVRTLGWAQMDKLGIDAKTGHLYWDGERVVTDIQLSRRDRFLAVVATLSAASMALLDLVRFALGE